MKVFGRGIKKYMVEFMFWVGAKAKGRVGVWPLVTRFLYPSYTCMQKMNVLTPGIQKLYSISANTIIIILLENEIEA